MKSGRNIMRLIPLMLALLTLNVLFGTAVFSWITDTDPAHKLTLFVDAETRNEDELAAMLEEAGLPDAIRMVRVHPFSYAMFDSSRLRTADLYILPVSDLSEYGEWLAPLPGELRSASETFFRGTEAVGIRIDPAAENWIEYHRAEEDSEAFCLCFGSRSVHGEDGAALALARALLAMQ